MSDSPSPTASATFPDVLGYITDGSRHLVGIVQCAFTLYPRAVALSQAFELLILLQNTSDQPIVVSVTAQLPKKDTQGRRLGLVTQRDSVTFTLPPAETGLLHMPVVPHAPTQPSQGNALSVKIEARPPKTYNLLRLLQGGRPPAILKLSKARLNVLRELAFTGVAAEPGILSSMFDVVAGNVEHTTQDLKAPWYETFWHPSELAADQAKYAALEEKARRFARIFAPMTLMDSMMAVTIQRFNQAGLPLMQGEVLAIAKALVYIMMDNVERNYALIERRWFQQLVVNIEDEALTGDIRKLVATLYTDIVHDAVRVGLPIVERVSGEHLGSPREHFAFADELVAVLDEKAPGGLVHIYLPLVLVGVLFNGQLRGARENPWTNLDKLGEARASRQQSASENDEFLFSLLQNAMQNAEQYLTKNQIPRK